MKKIIRIGFLLIAPIVYSQVGINTSSPEATLDIRGKNHLGAVTATDGILIPRVNNLSTNGSMNGQIVYLIATTGNLTKGFYYWNGSAWTGIDATNDAWVNDAANTGIKLGTKSDGTSARAAGTELVVKDDGKVGIGTAAPTAALDINGALRIQQTPAISSTQGNTILFEDANGNVKQMDSNAFVNALDIPKLLFAGKDFSTFTMNWNSVKVVPFTTIIADSGNSWNAATYKYTVPGDGVYQLNAKLSARPDQSASSSSGTNFIALNARTSGAGGSQFAQLDSEFNMSSLFTFNLNGSAEFYMKQGDEIWVTADTCVGPSCNQTTVYTVSSPSLITITRKTYN